MSKVLTERQKQLKEKYLKERGYWAEDLFGAFLRLDPDYLEAYLNLSAVPWKKGVLPPKVKEFIYIAIDASVTHLHSKGLRVHIATALKLGATKEELVEVLELVSGLGVQSSTMGMPILEEEWDKFTDGQEKS